MADHREQAKEDSHVSEELAQSEIPKQIVPQPENKDKCTSDEDKNSHPEKGSSQPEHTPSSAEAEDDGGSNAQQESVEADSVDMSDTGSIQARSVQSTTDLEFKDQEEARNSSSRIDDENELLRNVCLRLVQNDETSQGDTKRQVSDSILKLLVTEDMSNIKSPTVLKSLFVDYLHLLPPQAISEVLSVLIAIVKKSVFHLESARGLTNPCINYLVSGASSETRTDAKVNLSDNQTATTSQASSGVSLTQHFLREWLNLLVSHSCDVEELRTILKFSAHDPSLLNFLQTANMRQKTRPSAFFAFPGTKGSMISLPPFQKWPTQTGWSFSVWFYLEPKACAQPYLYSFKTGKSGLGYSAHFTGNCLVLTSIRVKGKGVQHCVAYEFPSYKWTHCAITYHNKWRVSETKVYVNGQLAANIEMPWQVQTTEIYDKCFIGGSGSITKNDRSGELNCFCGQLSSVYLFNEGLSPVQICAIHRLGPSYMGQFKYRNESQVNLPPQISKALYDEKLASTLFCTFTPVAVDSGTLCIQLAPFKSSIAAASQNYFISAPHAALVGQTRAIITQPIWSTLQSIGCSRSLLPLIDVFAGRGDSEACALLIEFLCDLFENSPNWFANEIVQNNGFVVVAGALANDARQLMSERLLDIFLNLTRMLLTTSTSASSAMLLKHLVDNILINPQLWLYAEPKVRTKLYSYLANEFLNGTRQLQSKFSSNNTASQFIAYSPTSSAATAMSNQSNNFDDQFNPKSTANEHTSYITELLFSEIRRVSTVLQTIHSLKYFYWVAEEADIHQKGRNNYLRPHGEELILIRSHVLSFIEQLIDYAGLEPFDEIQGLLNYLASCDHGDNLLDVLDLLWNLIKKDTAKISKVVAFDQKQGVKVLFHLIGSNDERVRIKSLRILGLFLAQCDHKKKAQIMEPYNLFMLLCDKLRPFRPITWETYDALMSILIQDTEYEGLSFKQDAEARSKFIARQKIHNPMIIKVIATLVHEEQVFTSSKSQTTTGKVNIRAALINDLWNLIVNSKENRRAILQMSVWQHWLINLIDSTLDESQIVRDQVLALFRVLLYHAIRYEYGGWRVWVDTIAIIHTKVSYDEFRQQLETDPTVREFVTDEYENVESSATKLNQKSTAPSRPKSRSKSPDRTQTTVHVDNLEVQQSDHELNQNDNQESGPPAVTSISERVPRESGGIQMCEEEAGQASVERVDELDTKSDTKSRDVCSPDETKSSDVVQPESRSADLDCPTDGNQAVDTTDLAPSRAFRRMSLSESKKNEAPTEISSSPDTNVKPQTSSGGGDLSRQHSLTSIPLEESTDSASTIGDHTEEEKLKSTGETLVDTSPALNKTDVDETIASEDHQQAHPSFAQPPQKAAASPAFRIPAFKWSYPLIKLLSDLMFSIECDLYNWRCQAKCPELDSSIHIIRQQPHHGSRAAGANTISRQASNSANSRQSQPPNVVTLESILQRKENQVYTMNVVHFVSQLADNFIIAAGGLLPLLADATGGSRASSSSSNGSSPAASSPPTGSKNRESTLNQTIVTCEGLTVQQANSFLYRLASIADVVVFASSHINLGDLETDKNTTSGGILRQCLRLACTVTVKNCLIIRSIHNKLTSLGIGVGEYSISDADFPKNIFDSYQGCTMLSANGLFENSALTLEENDLIANVDFTPHQMPNSSSMPSLLPFHASPIQDPNKLLQFLDINRIQACIYHEPNSESRQAQFLALSSLYFISVLMVSKYRDIIEPKNKIVQNHPKALSASAQVASPSTSSGSNQPSHSDSNEVKIPSVSRPSVSSIESNLLNFGKMQPHPTGPGSQSATSTTGTLTDLLTKRLEYTLDTVCPLLKSIMCDFCSFLSKTLIGSHGQDLVSKEADRSFRKTNTSPVELVMLLCSQEWQNTLQKNAGLAFIELINEGRVLSAGMKDHIVRVAMEAEYILSRLRAEDVSRHEPFNMDCAEILATRLHEEMLINSLITAAARRDYNIYCKFSDMFRNQRRKSYKLDVWEDDDRRKRRFVFDSWDDDQQTFFKRSNLIMTVDKKVTRDEDDTNNNASTSDNNRLEEAKRILELQETLELSGIDEHHYATSAHGHESSGHDPSLQQRTGGRDGDCDDYYDEDEDDDDIDEMDNCCDQGQPGYIGTPSPESDVEQQQSNENNSPRRLDHQTRGDTARATDDDLVDVACRTRTHPTHGKFGHSNTAGYNKSGRRAGQDGRAAKNFRAWDYEDCGSTNDFGSQSIFGVECSLVWATYAVPGFFQITANEIHFEPNEPICEAIDSLKKNPLSDSGNHASEQHEKFKNIDQPDLIDSSNTLRKIDFRVLRYCDFLTSGNGRIQLDDIKAIFSRHYLLQPHALEIFLAERTSVMFAFNDFDSVKRAIKYLPPVGVGIKYGIPQSRRASLMTPRQLFSASNMTQKWQRREISNFQYLTFLNTIAGRSYQDFNQYLVFPWILTNYESEELDLNLPSNFRDLSKPIGALNAKRRAEFVERYLSWDNPKVPAFHYGTHYSTAAFTLNWLCRLRGSYNSAYLALHDGRYEEDTRLFLSIEDCWVSSLVCGQQNVKELIPEFFYLPEMFHSNLGLPEVQYPPWAKSAEHFVRMHRLALESELVSCQLHQWIDLIFGYKQRGPEAVEAVNTFYYLTYQGNVNLNMVQDPSLRDAIETQIKHFGQTPSQLTTEPHPPRFSALHVSPLVFSPNSNEINSIIKFPFKASIVHISPCLSNIHSLGSHANASSPNDGSSPGTLANPVNLSSSSSIMTITSNNQYQIHRWSPSSEHSKQQQHSPLVIDPMLEHSGGRRQLVDIDDLYTDISLKLENDSNSDSHDDTVQWPSMHHVVTLDGHYIIMGSFYDNSFRVFSAENGKLHQVIYGHRGPITCMVRSEGNSVADFQLATGSQDCSLLLWNWNDRHSHIEGSGISSFYNPMPKLSISGHRAPVISAIISAELGLVVSGSKNLILVNATTSGECLIEIDVTLPNVFDRPSDEINDACASSGCLIPRPQVKDKDKAIFEASMIGENNPTRVRTSSSSTKSPNSALGSAPLSSMTSNRFAHLREMCRGNYYITNLQIARELALIVCTALPPPKKKGKAANYDKDRAKTRINSAALLMTFNLKGKLMESITIGQAANGPRFGNPCSLVITRDGEHLILNDSPATWKIYRTFDLQPTYAYNTNDIPNSVESLDQNTVRSLALIDHKYVLVGLENGKMIVYNVDFKNSNK